MDFSFNVIFGDKGTAQFEVVYGLEGTNNIIEYRHGDSQSFSTVKMQLTDKTPIITLSKGKYNSNSNLSDYINIFKNIAVRTDITIELMDTDRNKMMTWILSSAYISQIKGMDNKGNETYVEELIIEYEDMKIIGN